MLEFDDENEHSRLVYGIGLNKCRKRITVIFRGTYGEGTRDWMRNIQFDPCRVSIPEDIDTERECFQFQSEFIQFHRGFYEYLFHNDERGDKYDLERYEEIKENILGVLKDYPEYKLYICGHSLGGSLAQLAAFHIALANFDLVPQPVTCVSVGSPRVGDQNFLEAFRLLEKTGRIRYLRITNDNDPITYLPPFSWYRHVGMNLRLSKDGGFKMLYPSQGEDDQYEAWKSLFSLFSSPTSVREAVQAHYLPEYLRRLSRAKEALIGVKGCPLYLDECYQDERIVGDL
mmetsp:Transcript_11442/g.33728  ORF Transcript_11442/g.33728 Transcript_11442/m.33728 type:complete len:287 (-) Transcript_11442:57-917(-)